MPTPKDNKKLEENWRKERVAILQRNIEGAARHESNLADVRRRHGRRLSFLVTCMDERLALLEDHLQLLPNEAKIFASAGGKIETDQFIGFFGRIIDRCGQIRRQAAIYLVTHGNSEDHNLGCASFADDNDESKIDYFIGLRRQLVARFPEAFVHALMFDTANGQLSELEIDDRDDRLSKLLTEGSSLIGKPPEMKEHAGYGIYVGDAYRAWINQDNAFFQISALNPDLGRDIRTALRTIKEQSVADLRDKPVILHLDLPIYTNYEHTGECRRNIEKHVKELLKEPEFKQMRDLGQLRIMRTETEMVTWLGMDVS